ncbi:MAG: CDP-glucose 4,6-dehydratase [Beijerinckiaceae bacterium]
MDAHYRCKRVAITGHTGFKGSWLSCWLELLGASVTGISLPPVGDPNLFNLLELDRTIDSHFADIRELGPLTELLRCANPEVVFHLAAQPLVRRSYADPIETFSTNVLGTAHVLEACRATPSVRAVVVVTTDKVYENREWHWPYRESDPLGGLDPYSASKACAEIVTGVYQKNICRGDRRIHIATARGGNVIGGGDWSVDRIVPDIIRAISADAPIELRNPGAVRPWQHVLELCEGYLALGAGLLAGDDRVEQAWNFGPWLSEKLSVSEITKGLLAAMERPGHPVLVSPSPLHEAQTLQLDISKTVSQLGWRPRLRVQEALVWTADWYREVRYDPRKARELTLRQIGAFEALIERAVVAR